MHESGFGPERRKVVSGPMSAIGVPSGLVLLTRSFVESDPKLTCVMVGLKASVPYGSEGRPGDVRLRDIRRAIASALLVMETSPINEFRTPNNVFGEVRIEKCANKIHDTLVLV